MLMNICRSYKKKFVFNFLIFFIRVSESQIGHNPVYKIFMGLHLVSFMFDIYVIFLILNTKEIVISVRLLRLIF